METNDPKIETIISVMNATPVRMNMYTFIYAIAAVADKKVKEVFVEEYAKTFIGQLYENESDSFKNAAVKELKDYIMRETENK